MKKLAFELDKTSQFSKLFLDLMGRHPSLDSFCGHSPSIKSFLPQIEAKRDAYKYRKEIGQVLQRQSSSPSKEQLASLQKLSKANCFTVTTGHQLGLATGPLYFIYKILTTIKLSERLKEQYKEFDFVPVFWMATEDHDFEEINHFYLFGKKYEWQREAKGAVGHLSTNGLEALLDQVPDLPLWLKDAYTQSAHLAEATRKIVNHLFSEYGLLVIDGDDKELKSLITPLIKKDLVENAFSPVIRSTTDRLQKAGYKTQAFVRDQNFFFLEENARERIELQGDQYHVLNTSHRFTKQQIENKIEQSPECFSPNVLLRPMYQESILPNLAYIGGPGEIAYWLQLKDVFDAEEIPFPILFPRNFLTVLNAGTLQKLEEIGLYVENLFQSEQDFQQMLLSKLNIGKFDFTSEEHLLANLKGNLIEKANQVDKTLAQAAEAEMTRIGKSILDFQKRLDKAMENRHQADINKFQSIRKKIFPDGELQERHDNFLSFYINHPDFVTKIYEALDPFEFKMNCVLL